MKMQKIGLVYDLRELYLEKGYSAEQTAEFDTVESISAISEAMSNLGFEVDHVGSARELAARLVKGEVWDLVFSMAEGISGRSREAHVPAILELHDQPYALSDPLTMAVCMDKAVAKAVVANAGVPTAPWRVIDGEAEAARSWQAFPAFVKPLFEGTSKGCELASIVSNQSELELSARGLIRRFDQPVIVEPFLEGSEFTVGVIGNGSAIRVLGVAEITMKAEADQRVFTLRNKEDQHKLCEFKVVTGDLARVLEGLADSAYEALGCRDCCRLDFRGDLAGNLFFLEANPIPGLHPNNSDLPVLASNSGLKYEKLVSDVLSEAFNRYRSL